MEMEYDYIIVGAGSAGCALAYRLTEKGDSRVLLLEAGRPYNKKSRTIPLIGLYEQVKGEKEEAGFPYYWIDDLENRAGQCNAKKIWTGKGVGGGSAVNGMIYTRGAAVSYDLWEVPGWSYRDVLPYFRRMEDYEEGASDFHGQGGPVSVSRNRFRIPVIEGFIAACREAGLPHNSDFNAASQEGAGYFDLTQRNGRRASVAVAYLEPALRTGRVEVRTDTKVMKVLIEKGRAVGVELLVDGKREVARASREVVVSAGTLRTPQILMLSGIGPEEDLRQHGIDVVVPRKEVGKNLQDHLRVPLVYETAFRDPADLRGKLWGGVQYLMSSRGLLTSNNGDGGGFFTSPTAQGRPDIQFVIHWRAPQPGDIPKRADLEPCLVDARSRGHVTLRSSNPLDPPRVAPNYLAEEIDVKTLVWGLRFGRELARTNAFAKDYPLREELTPGADKTDDASLSAFVRSITETCFHPAGTCRMGTDADAVVDERLRLRGVEGLRIVDCSVMPKLINGNTNSAAMMIGEKASDLILEDA